MEILVQSLSDEKNRMIRDMDMTKFKRMQASYVYWQVLWSKAKQNDYPYYIINDLLYERSSNVDEPGLLVLPAKLREEVLYLAHDRLTGGSWNNKNS